MYVSEQQQCSTHLQKLMDASMGSSLYLSECESDLEHEQSLMDVSFQLHVEQPPDDRGTALSVHFNLYVLVAASGF